jgi:hypothetical protein
MQGRKSAVGRPERHDVTRFALGSWREHRNLAVPQLGSELIALDLQAVEIGIINPLRPGDVANRLKPFA